MLRRFLTLARAGGGAGPGRLHRWEEALKRQGIEFKMPPVVYKPG